MRRPPAPRSRFLLSLFVLLALGSSGCSVETEIPSEATITCPDGVCPSGWACNAKIGLCRPEYERDDQPPSLAGSAALVLSNAPYEQLALGARAVLTFQVSEPLRRAPVVRAGGALAFTLVAEGPERTYRFELEAAEGAPQRISQPIAIDLVDRAGNESGPIPAGALVFDYAAPQVALASAAYLPDPSNPLGAVTRAAAGTAISIAVLLDEPLVGTPALRATNGVGELEFSLDPLSRTEIAATFWAVVPPGLSDDPEEYLPAVTLTDRAGNTVAAPLPSARFQVRTRKPRLLVDQGAVTSVSSPSGNTVAEDLGGGVVLPSGPFAGLAPADPLSPEAHLPPAAFRLEGEERPPTRLRFWRSVEGASPLLIGEGASTARGWPRLALNNPTSDFVLVSALDEAGNESALVPLLAHEWVATAGREGVPTAALRLRSHETAPVDAEGACAASAAELESVAGLDGAGLAATSTQEWRERQPSPALPALESFASAFDAARGRVVLFGGVVSGDQLQVPQARTWEFDGSRWLERTPPEGGPSARSHAAMAFDAARNRVVLYGGQTEAGPGDDAWEWDGRQWTEIARVDPGAPHPGARRGHALAYDAARRRLLLFGGTDGAAPLGDTWTLAADTWTRLDGKQAPPPRHGHAMTFDPSGGAVVLHGGCSVHEPVGHTCSSGKLGDTWTLSEAGWTDVSAPDPSALHFAFHALAYDGQGLLMAASPAPGGLTPLQLWLLRGGTWSSRTAPDPKTPWPRARRGAALAHDPATGRTLLFGGPDAWLWDGAGLARLNPLRQPPASSGAEPSLAAGDGGVWLSSGRSPHDLWRWSGGGWEELTPADPVPMVNVPDSPAGGALAAHGAAVFFYGFLPQCANCFPSGLNGLLWRWDGAWSLVEAKTPSPAPRQGARLLGIDEGLLLVGGEAYSGDGVADTDTWLYAPSSGGWEVLPGLLTGRSSLNGHAAAWDPRRKKVVLFGGRAGMGPARAETWEWDRAGWRKVESQGPAARTGAAMSFDRGSGRVVLVGGLDATYKPLRDVWEWDGGVWREARSLPSARTGAGLADSPEGLVLFGGNYGFDQSTWLRPAQGERRPALQFAALLPDGPCRRGEITGLRVRARAGGQGGQGRRTAGVELYGWSTSGTWILLDSRPDLGIPDVSAPSALPAAPLLDWSSTPAAAPPLLLWRDCRIELQLRPFAGSDGSDESFLSVDYLEARVRYHPR